MPPWTSSAPQKVQTIPGQAPRRYNQNSPIAFRSAHDVYIPCLMPGMDDCLSAVAVRVGQCAGPFQARTQAARDQGERTPQTAQARGGGGAVREHSARGRDAAWQGESGGRWRAAPTRLLAQRAGPVREG